MLELGPKVGPTSVGARTPTPPSVGRDVSSCADAGAEIAASAISATTTRIIVDLAPCTASIAFDLGAKAAEQLGAIVKP